MEAALEDCRSWRCSNKDPSMHKHSPCGWSHAEMGVTVIPGPILAYIHPRAAVIFVCPRRARRKKGLLAEVEYMCTALNISALRCKH